MNVEPSYLDAKSGVAAWLLTRDHKRIGLMFLFATVVFLVLGGAFAMLLRTELVRPERDLFDASTYNRFFTLHGVIMVWLFLIPSIPSGFGNFVLPMMIGAKDVAFPRLNLASFYIYFVGALVILGSLVGGGVDTGWTFYTPYSASSPTAVVPTAIGIFIVGISSIITGINFITTVHTMRCKGMRWHRMPLFVWAIYATSIIQVLATPVLGLVLLLVGVDHAFGVGIFDPAVGGDPVLYQHLFWFYSHPAVYIMILPAMGVITRTPPGIAASRTRASASRSSASSPGGTTCSCRGCRPPTPRSSACSRCSWRSSPRSRCSPGPSRSIAAASCSPRRCSTCSRSCFSSCSAG
jgi:cytochrome c oxidase subunit 1